MSQPGKMMDEQFVQLVLSLQAGAMQQMGKFASPLTGKIERDLNMAKASIDMLGMLEAKTKGNLTDDEQKVLNHILYELRLNYVDESKKSEDQKETDKPDEKTVSSDNTADAAPDESETSEEAVEKPAEKPTGEETGESEANK